MLFSRDTLNSNDKQGLQGRDWKEIIKINDSLKLQQLPYLFMSDQIALKLGNIIRHYVLTEINTTFMYQIKKQGCKSHY